MASSVMPTALSSLETCASSMALSCSFEPADTSGPLAPRNSVCAETRRLSPDDPSPTASVVTVIPRVAPEAAWNHSV